MGFRPARNDGLGDNDDTPVTSEWVQNELTNSYGLKLDIVEFESDGTFTKADYPNAEFYHVVMVGGGAAGGGSVATGAGQSAVGAGGGAGEYAERAFLPSDFAVTESVTIGTGGTGVSAGQGNGGGTTSLGSLLTALGGEGGNGGNATTGTLVTTQGQGGSGGSGGGLRWRGSDGHPGVIRSGLIQNYGHGGASKLSGQQTALITTGSGIAGYEYGGGGTGAISGSSNPAFSGGAGADGICVIYVFSRNTQSSPLTDPLDDPADGTFPVYDTATEEWVKSIDGSQNTAKVENTTNPSYRIANTIGASAIDSAIIGVATSNNAFVNGSVAGDMAIVVPQDGKLIIGSSESPDVSSSSRIELDPSGVAEYKAALPAVGTETMELATTAFVQQELDAKPRAHLYFADNQNIPHNSLTKMIANLGSNSIVDSTGSMADAANSRIVIPKAGDYKVGGSIRWSGSVGVNLVCGGIVLLNGVTQVCNFLVTQDPGNPASITFGNSQLWPLAVNDYLELHAYWNYSGGSGFHTVAGGSQAVFIHATWEGD